MRDALVRRLSHLGDLAAQATAAPDLVGTAQGARHS
jgi:hypothetical protein